MLAAMTFNGPIPQGPPLPDKPSWCLPAFADRNKQIYPRTHTGDKCTLRDVLLK